MERKYRGKVEERNWEEGMEGKLWLEVKLKKINIGTHHHKNIISILIHVHKTF